MQTTCGVGIDPNTLQQTKTHATSRQKRRSRHAQKPMHFDKGRGTLRKNKGTKRMKKDINYNKSNTCKLRVGSESTQTLSSKQKHTLRHAKNDALATPKNRCILTKGEAH